MAARCAIEAFIKLSPAHRRRAAARGDDRRIGAQFGEGNPQVSAGSGALCFSGRRIIGARYLGPSRPDWAGNNDNNDGRLSSVGPHSTRGAAGSPRRRLGRPGPGRPLSPGAGGGQFGRRRHRQYANPARIVPWASSWGWPRPPLWRAAFGGLGASEGDVSAEMKCQRRAQWAQLGVSGRTLANDDSIGVGVLVADVVVGLAC